MSTRRTTWPVRAVVLLVMGLAAATVSAATASAATVAINLCAVPGTLAPLPSAAPGVTVPIWGFASGGAGGAPNCSGVTATLPGPVLSVNEGDSVTIRVANALPAGHTLSFEVPGIGFVPGPVQAAVGATVSRTFVAAAPGSYLYQSGGDAGRQEAMGLFGALIVRSGTAGQAYDSPATAYNVEAPLVLSAIDPAFNAAPATFDVHAFRATYWLINGRAYPDTSPGIVAAPGQRVLLRYLNAGYDNSTMLLLGMHEHVVARDARLLGNPLDASAETIPSGATEDAIATVPTGSPPSARGFPLYNGQLHLTNGPQTGTSPLPVSGGGMLTFIHP